jgi:hypothetical protein
MSDTVSLADGTLLSGAAVADVFAGHLGVFESSSGPSSASSNVAYFTITFSVSGAMPGDFLTAQMKLNGSFTPGGGATAQLLDFDFGNLMTVTCNQYNVTNYGMGCVSGYSSGPPVLSNMITYNVPLDGRSSVTLQGVLQVGAATAPYSLDFLNSADLTFTVPSGTVVNGNPGGNLIQGAVPEPTADALLFTGVLGLAVVRRRPRVHPRV